MIIPDNVRKCVVFLGFKMADGSYRMAGSAFFFAKFNAAGIAPAIYLATAKHVIEGIKGLGTDTIQIRYNTKNGASTWRECPISIWYSHPSDNLVDISIMETSIDAEFDHIIFPNDLFITDEIIEMQNVSLGDEVFITGLFKHHRGEQRNIPIIRIGNLAAFAEENVITKEGAREAFLIECRSIGGLSGSPVFFNLGNMRPNLNGNVIMTGGQNTIYLAGIIHGHFDEKIEIKALETKSLELNSQTSGADRSEEKLAISVEQINTGIAIVTPIQKLLELVQLYEGNNYKLRASIEEAQPTIAGDISDTAWTAWKNENN